MYRLILSDKQLQDVVTAEKKHKTWDIKRRLRTIRLRHTGIPSKEICERLEVSPHAVTHWVKIFLSGGVEALCSTRYHERRSSELDCYIAEVKHYLTHNPSSSTKDLQSYLYERTKRQYDQSWIRKWLKSRHITEYIKKPPE